MLTYDDLLKRLISIKNQGYIKTHRGHNTGIGKTFEDLLGINENNFRIPDVGDVELKAKRTASSSMLTLATSTPHPRGAIRELFKHYKYLDSEGYYNLHSTICGSVPNPQSLKLKIVDNKLVIQNDLNIEAYWPLSFFNDILKAKSNKILLAFADTRGKTNTKDEEFHFNEAYLLSGLNIDKFESAIMNDKLKVDLRVGVYRSGVNKGRYHDHGTGFRMFKKDFLHLYDNYNQVI